MLPVDLAGLFDERVDAGRTEAHTVGVQRFAATTTMSFVAQAILENGSKMLSGREQLYGDDCCTGARLMFISVDCPFPVESLLL